MKPHVTVIVPVYNKEKQIRRCIESLLNQKYDNYTVLIVDDGSTDNSYHIATSYNSKHLKVLKKDNGGVSSARNFGIEHAKGEYIIFVDSDDWVTDRYISDFFQLNQYTYNSIGIQAIELLGTDKKRRLNFYDDIVIDKTNLSNGIGKYRLLHTGYPFAKLYRLDLLRKHNIRFLEGLPTHEDHVFVWTYMQYVDRIVLCANTNYKYIVDENPESLSKSLYNPEIFIKASDALLNALNQIKKAIPIDKKYYHRAQTDFGLTQRIRAILSAYIKDFDIDYRKKLLNEEFYLHKALYKNYKSKRWLQNIVLKIMIHTPIKVLDKLLYSTISILGIKGKDVRLFIK